MWWSSLTIYDWPILSPSEISDRFPISETQDFTMKCVSNFRYKSLSEPIMSTLPIQLSDIVYVFVYVYVYRDF